MDLEVLREQEYFKSICQLCNGESLPFPIHTTFGLLQHISEQHLPLKCDKCDKIFETIEDLKDISKCNHLADNTKLQTVVEEGNEENEILIISDGCGNEISTPTYPNLPNNNNNNTISITIETKSNTLKRQTSTPMLNELKTTFSDPSASAIQLSSINSTSGGSSIETEYSPLENRLKGKPLTVTISPKRNTKRQKMAVEATPLRQVMSKSIQRAMAEYSKQGNYRGSAFISQRKMSFNSSNSSSDQSLSLQKFQTSLQTSAPLDLRLSPAIRRHSDENANILQTNVTQQTIEIKQVEVYIRRSEIKCDTTTSTNYESVLSDSSQSETKFDIQQQNTPKIVGHSNFMKKAMSFETQTCVESTPVIFPTKVDTAEFDDEVFYTPNSSPVKASTYETKVVEYLEEEKKPKIWSFVRKLSENISESLSNDKLWIKFKKPIFIKRAEDFFRSDKDDEIPAKRRRTSSQNNETRGENQMSPALKRQRIQGRKPISRMRQLS